jgi:hypothetical protein
MHSTIYYHYQDSNPISQIQPGDILYAYELPSKFPPPADADHVAFIVVNEMSNRFSSTEKFGVPLLVTMPREDTKYFDRIYRAVAVAAQRYTTADLFETIEQKETENATEASTMAVDSPETVPEESLQQQHQADEEVKLNERTDEATAEAPIDIRYDQTIRPRNNLFKIKVSKSPQYHSRYQKTSMYSYSYGGGYSSMSQMRDLKKEEQEILKAIEEQEERRQRRLERLERKRRKKVEQAEQTEQVDQEGDCIMHEAENATESVADYASPDAMSESGRSVMNESGLSENETLAQSEQRTDSAVVEQKKDDTKADIPLSNEDEEDESEEDEEPIQRKPLIETGQVAHAIWTEAARNHFFPKYTSYHAQNANSGKQSKPRSVKDGDGTALWTSKQVIKIPDPEEVDKGPLTLERCLEEFTRAEKLSEEDSWYCPHCKVHRQATKKFDIWRLPNTLVVHLKRFGQSRSWRDKIDDMVKFPLE